MRRMRFIAPLCLLLLFVPIYLWQVQGFRFSGNDEVPPRPVDPIDEKPWNPMETKDFERGSLAGAIVSSVSHIDPIALLAQTEPVELLRECLLRYRESAQNYTCTLVMQEKVKGKLKPPETIEAWFKEEPFSVFMHWKQGEGLASASLYVAGDHGGKMCVRPSGAAKVLGWVKRAPDSTEAKDSSRYHITEFGLRCGTERTYKAWKLLQAKGVKLQVEYLGLRKNVSETGGRDCHVIRRICNPPEEDGLTEVTLFIDAETWFQVGSVLKAKDDLIGYYYFKDINLKPTFEEGRFKTDMLKKY